MKNLRFLTIAISSLILSGCFSSPPDKNRDDIEELHVLWQYAYDLDGGAPKVRPLVYRNQIITSGDNNITSLEIENGTIIWNTPLNHHTSLRNRTFGVSGKTLVGSVLNQTLAWNIETGIEKWRVHFEDSLTYSDLSGITATEEKFIGFGTSGELYKLSLDGEREIDWIDIRSYESTYSAGQLFITHRSPPLAGELQYGVLQSINLRTMGVNWVYETPGYGYVTRIAPLIDKNTLFAGTADGASYMKHAFFALNANTGEEIWKREGIFTYSAVLVGDYIYVNDAAGIYKLRKMDGGIEWYSDFRAGAGTAPIAYGYGFLYAPHAGTMHVVDAETGEIVHRFSPPDGSYFWRVTAGAGRIFAQSNRHLYAFAPWGHTQPLEE